MVRLDRRGSTATDQRYSIIYDHIVDPKPSKNIWIADLLRWISASMVVLSHARDNLIRDPAQGHGFGLVDLFYFLSGFGHQAVVVFFVLSGYLVGGGLWLHHARGGSLGAALFNYYGRRFSRIYIVLVPALLITGLLDTAGRSFLNAGLYEHGVWSHSLSFDSGGRSDPATLLCNIGNLQDAFCSPYGTNIALWSLSYEWFYYVTFPGIVFIGGYLQRRLASRTSLFLSAATFLAVALLLFVMAAILPRFQEFVAYYPIWLAGVAARVATVKLRPKRAIAPLAGGLTLLALLAGRIGWGTQLMADTVVGLCLAAFLADYRILGIRGRLAALNESMANFSYSLYAIHFPTVIFAVAALQAGGIVVSRLEPNASGFVVLGLVIGFVYLVAWLFANATEVHTAKLFSYLTSLAAPADGLARPDASGPRQPAFDPNGPIGDTSLPS